MKELVFLLLTVGPALLAQETNVVRKVDPTWLYRHLPDLREQHSDLSSSSCHYRAVFGEGDTESRVFGSVVRFGELTVDAHGSCASINYPRQEELYFTLEGEGVLRYGDESHPLRKNDFTYVPPTVPHSVSNPAGQPFQIVA